MDDWGRDIFPVGSSAGLGGYALMVDNEITRLGILGADTLNNIEKTKLQNCSRRPCKFGFKLPIQQLESLRKQLSSNRNHLNLARNVCLQKHRKGKRT